MRDDAILTLGLLLGGALGGATAAPAQPPSAPADLVFRGGTVRTADPDRPAARAVAVRAGRIVFVGDEAGLRPWIAATTRVVDLRGGALLPGLHDSHVHPAKHGADLDDCLLHDDTTLTLVAAHVARCARERPGAPWLRGAGWQPQLFPDANPGRALLDSLVPDRPAYLVSADVHAAWANSRALAAAGITAATPDPPRGRIERDPRTGAPTGTLRETAMALVERHVPPRTPAEWERGAERALALAASLGLTSLYDARADSNMLEGYAALERRGALAARVVAAVDVDPGAAVADEVARLRRLRSRFRGPRLRVIAAKILVDGAPEARTAALLAPYAGSTERGAPLIVPSHLDSLAVALDRAGFQLHLHVAGDRAVRLALDAVAAARRANGPRDARHTIAHLALVDPADVPRFRALGVYANVQPYWAFRDGYVRDVLEPALGPARAGRLFPIGTLLRSGAAVVAGSDWSVTTMDPLAAMQVAVTRRAPEAAAGPAWLPRERAPLARMLAAYTVNGARLAFQERATGSITVGKAADLVVLDRDVFAVAPQEIRAARVRATFLDGQETYSAGR
jgi:predicted amidohydrolase YtcJ